MYDPGAFNQNLRRYDSLLDFSCPELQNLTEQVPPKIFGPPAWSFWFILGQALDLHLISLSRESREYAEIFELGRAFFFNTAIPLLPCNTCSEKGSLLVAQMKCVQNSLEFPFLWFLYDLKYRVNQQLEREGPKQEITAPSRSWQTVMPELSSWSAATTAAGDQKKKVVKTYYPSLMSKECLRQLFLTCWWQLLCVRFSAEKIQFYWESLYSLLRLLKGSDGAWELSQIIARICFVKSATTTTTLPLKDSIRLQQFRENCKFWVEEYQFSEATKQFILPLQFLTDK